MMIGGGDCGVAKMFAAVWRFWVGFTGGGLWDYSVMGKCAVCCIIYIYRGGVIVRWVSMLQFRNVTSYMGDGNLCTDTPTYVWGFSERFLVYVYDCYVLYKNLYNQA